MGFILGKAPLLGQRCGKERDHYSRTAGVGGVPKAQLQEAMDIYGTRAAAIYIWRLLMVRGVFIPSSLLWLIAWTLE